MTEHDSLLPSSALARLIEEDAVGLLRRRTGKMLALGSENGEPKLDWVEGVARLLADPAQLELVEAEARALWQQGVRYIIWAGMGGSVITVRVLARMGFCAGHAGAHIAIYPLDSTDPAALNAIVQQIATAKQLTLPAHTMPPTAAWLRALLSDVMMIGVSMGMTSEEPITHLTWFAELLEQAQLTPAEHLLVMTLPNSYLDIFARERQAPSRPLQLDLGTGTGGRMSAPTTRVFLLPAALYLTRLSDAPGQLRAMLNTAWRDYALDLATTQPAAHPFVRLAAALYEAGAYGACRLLLETPADWQPVTSWIEQLMEESLGKGQLGVVAFHEQPLATLAPAFRTTGTLHVLASSEDISSATPQSPRFILHQPYLAATEPQARLAAVATSFLGWQLTMALYGYLQEITFAGQPAVENYKARARALKSMRDPLLSLQDWPATFTMGALTLFAPLDIQPGPTLAATFAQTLQHAALDADTRTRLGYLDFTINGAVPETFKRTLAGPLHELSNTLLGVPLKFREAPADYHSTEQGEMDGPPYLVSLRLLLREHDPVLIGSYSSAFLRAQAVSTWQAMLGQGRSCFLLLVDGSSEQALASTLQFFAAVLEYLKAR